MSKRSSRGNKSNSAVAVKLAPAPQPNAQVVQQMAQQWGGTTYGPNAPIMPYPGLMPQGGPRVFAYPIATNLNLSIRDNLTPFEVLRQFADLYDVIRLCLQSWFDCAANLELDIVPVDGLLAEGETADKYASDIARYKDFFESPDKQHTMHEWLNAALEDLAVIDAVAIYPRLTYSGDLYALDLIDASTVKPLLDDRGRTPTPPFYAYEQIVYGAPATLLTSDELLYLKEHNRTKSAFGFSRVENIIMRINQALRKQNLDMSMFTDGNIPAGFISPAADVGWGPEQLASYQMMFDSLIAGNDALRARAKVLPPGGTFIPTNPVVMSTDLDMLALKITHASFGVMPSQSGFTDDVNKATAESQGEITYQRTLKPIAGRFARLFTLILKKYFNETRFKAVWKGYEAQDDFSAMVSDHVKLVGAGIEKPNNAALALKLGDQGPDVPRFIMTKTGPFVVDDLANTEVRNAQVKDLTTAQDTAQQSEPPQDDKGARTGNVAVGNAGTRAPESSSKDTKGKSEEDGSEGKTPNEKSVKRVAGDEEQEEHTGMMVAFMLDSDTAYQLAVPEGASPSDMHVTLAYLGDKNEIPPDGKLNPAQNVEHIAAVLRGYTQSAQPLQGNVGGVARFTPSASSDEMSPVIALVNVQGLQDWRRGLVETLTQTGYYIANDFDYTPHITLAYIPADAAMPVESVEPLPLHFDTLALAIGDERHFFPLGVISRSASENTAQVDLRKWRDMAIARVKAGKSLRPFVSVNIPGEIQRRIEHALTTCKTVDEVRTVFSMASVGMDNTSFFV